MTKNPTLRITLPAGYRPLSYREAREMVLSAYRPVPLLDRGWDQIECGTIRNGKVTTV